MPQSVFSFHYIGLNLKKGVTAAHFEAFARDRGIGIPAYPGWQWTLLKGLRGERTDQYLMLHEAPDQAAYERYVDPYGQPTQAAREFWRERREARELIATWKSFATFAEPPAIFSRYTLVAESVASTLPEGPNFRVNDDGTAQARVVGIHNIALRPGVTAETFESFIRANVHRLDDYPGWKFHLLKGDGGSRLDQYAVMIEVESLESLLAFHPELDVSTELALAFVREHQDSERVNEAWRELASFPGAPQLYTDYIAIAGNRQE